jgi:Paraquat-inducible protein A
MVSVSKRGSILLWLDFFAKWSIIDVFVLIITIVTFRISIVSPELSFLPKDFYALDLLVLPKWGLYANMTAQIISQLSSHVIIHYHRRIIENSLNRVKAGRRIQHAVTTPTDDDVSDVQPPLKNVEPATSDSEIPKVLFRHAFYRAHRGEADRLVIRKFVNPVLLASSVFTCGLIIAGCFVPSYSLDILGLVGVLVESGQDFQKAGKKFNVLSTLDVLFGQAKLTGQAADYVGLISLSILLFCSVLVVPVLQLATLLVQWFMPLRPRLRHQLTVTLEVMQAWQYAEVYLLSLLVGAWQLGSVSGK